ncbi:tetratricopeptide repeat protein [Qipengyuania sp. DGS5-3]|uniref:tetratricopeptide repeat protein n=1 Tax=Qipengyuania sp. DGS5-3 TaxID=3349632 RepID=UPI0036D2B59F
MSPAQAQTASREIVQPLPPAASGDLNRALRVLARSPRNLEALLNAGNASLDLNDNAAAIGFFTRAREVDAQDRQVLHGLARAQLALGQPVEALDLFAQAEEAGIDPAEIEADRGLAYDLVGENARARELYQRTLNRGDDDELRRRLALSHAISGNRPAFERELYAQLEKADRAGFRARAFGLAILGDGDEAVKIAEALMPTDLALRMAPYLRYMPRLTKAQQAAAANLGVFPRAANIGRDDPSIAEYAARGAEITAQANDALTPSGEPLGTQANEVAAPTQANDEPRRRPDRIDAAAPGDDGAQAVVVQAAVNSEESTTQGQEAPIASVADAFGDFSSSAPQTAGRTEGAVDITSIEPPREVEEVEEAVPPEPVHPARHWVQVATGRDRAALRFDWRRIARAAGGLLEGKGPLVATWGQTNRLLAGPYDSARSAREIVNDLKELEIDSFSFSSSEGQEIESLR